MDALLLPLLGALVGLVLAVTGAGGTILAAPLLVFVLHAKLSQAAPVALLAVALAAASGAALGWLRGELRYRAAAWLAITGLLAAPLGLWLARRLPERPLLVLFAFVLAVVAVRAIRQAVAARAGTAPAAGQRICRLDPADGRLHWTVPCAAVLAVVGASAGLLSGLLGVGGGFVLVPALLAATDLPRPSVITTSMGAIALVSAGGAVSAALAGWLDFDLAWPFALGALAGMVAGRAWAGRLRPGRSQQAFAMLAGGVALALLWRAA